LENVKDFNFDLDVVRRNPRGEILKNKPKTEQELAEIEFSNQVYERVFRKLVKRDEEKSSESDEDLTAEDMSDVRSRWLD
jgi:hypothetical protein